MFYKPKIQPTNQSPTQSSEICGFVKNLGVGLICEIPYLYTNEHSASEYRAVYQASAEYFLKLMVWSSISSLDVKATGLQDMDEGDLV